MTNTTVNNNFTSKILLLVLILNQLIACTSTQKKQNKPDLIQQIVTNAPVIHNGKFENREKDKKSVQNFVDQNYKEILNIKTKNWSENRILFDGLAKMNFYLKDERLNQFLERIYWSLDKENFTKDSDREYLYDFYNNSRQYEKARVFVSKLREWQSKEFEDPPTLKMSLRPKAGPLLMNVKDKKDITLKKFPLETYTGMIMVGTPHCGWSKRALKAFSKHTNTSKKKHITLITPQEALDVESITKWNIKNQGLPYWPVYKEAAFPEISFSSTPTFYFLKNGKINKKVNGWPKEGRMKTVKDEFHKIGLEF